MVQILAGEKGEGKTKKLIDMANTAMKSANGHIVYIDDDSRHTYDISHDIRFVDTSEYPLSNYRELVGFIYGIFSQDSDIEKVFIDGLFKIVKNLEGDDIIKLAAKLKAMSEKYSVDFIIAANTDEKKIPEELKDLLI
ncbi:MAG: twitching motility protein PilT [Firmicutes bacterium]|nr:twitching motility protein PilT [Bacillota bacterium]